MRVPNYYGLQDSQQIEPKSIGLCEGCEKDILEHDDYIDWNGMVFHNEEDCTYQYVSGQGVLKIQ